MVAWWDRPAKQRTRQPGPSPGPRKHGPQSLGHTYQLDSEETCALLHTAPHTVEYPPREALGACTVSKHSWRSLGALTRVTMGLQDEIVSGFVERVIYKSVSALTVRLSLILHSGCCTIPGHPPCVNLDLHEFLVASWVLWFKSHLSPEFPC
jgi:hypothetical protein